MPVLASGVPFPTPDPNLRIENELPPGAHMFQLVCVDEGGNESEPAMITVTVRGRIIVDPIPEPERPDRLDPGRIHRFDTIPGVVVRPRPIDPDLTRVVLPAGGMVMRPRRPGG